MCIKIFDKLIEKLKRKKNEKKMKK